MIRFESKSNITFYNMLYQHIYNIDKNIYNKYTIYMEREREKQVTKKNTQKKNYIYIYIYIYTHKKGPSLRTGPGGPGRPARKPPPSILYISCIYFVYIFVYVGIKCYKMK